MASQVPHSTDWLSTKLPGLSDLEATFRCHVCKDFYQTPMLTECSHTFCSICIRRALSNDGKCPACRSPQQENKLRSSVSLGEAIEAFVRVRPAVLEIAGGRGGQSENARSPKRRTGPDPEPSNKRLRTSARLISLKNTSTEEETRTAVQSQLGSDNVDGTFPDYEYEEPFRHGGPNENHTPSDVLVLCPICSRRMKEVAVSNHIDNGCPGGPLPPVKCTQSTAISSTSAFSVLSSRSTAPVERLPAINYSMLKDHALRRKLAEVGIPNHGPRPIVENRHKEWVTLWNANCDSRRPQKRSELLRQLDTWERTLGTLAPSSSKASVAANKIRDKDFDASAWSAQHSDDFKALISQARKSRDEDARCDRVETLDAGSGASCPGSPPFGGTGK